MLVIELPAEPVLSVRYVMTVGPKPVKLNPNRKLLERIKKIQNGQSRISRQRQKFISGMPIYRMTPDELQHKRDYIEEWHDRIRENTV